MGTKKLQISHHTVLVATPFVAPVTTKGMATLDPVLSHFLVGSAVLQHSTFKARNLLAIFLWWHK